MHTNKRIYPSERTPSKWLSYLLLFLSAVIVLSGLAGSKGDLTTIESIATETPEPMADYFDETRETREISLSSQTWYALQLGAFEKESSANEQALLFQKRGAAGYVWLESRYRVLAAVYPLREDAQLVREQLQERHSIDSYLYEITLPELQLRLTGMKGQLDILQAAFLHADDLITNLQLLSVTLDRQEIGNEESIQTLQTYAQQLDQVAMKLEQRFSPPRNDVVQQLISFFREYSSFARNIQSTESSAALGQRIKFQTLRSLWILHQLRDTL